MPMNKTSRTLTAIGFSAAMVAGVLIAISYNKDKTDVKDEVVVKEEPAQPTQSTPVPKSLPFKCGNPKDIVVGTRIRDTCDDCFIPPGALGTVIGGIEKCSDKTYGFVVLYDNYRSSDENGGWCASWKEFVILSQPTCEN